MVYLPFKHFVREILDHRKTQTIRFWAKKKAEVGDPVIADLKIRFKIGTVSEVIKKPLKDLTQEEAVLDGFKDLDDARAGLLKMSRETPIHLDSEATIIRWVPTLSKIRLVADTMLKTRCVRCQRVIYIHLFTVLDQLAKKNDLESASAVCAFCKEISRR